MSLLESQYRAGQNLRSVGWQGQLEQADHEQAVLSVARDFLAQISPEEISSLPLDCRPGRLVDADDVSQYAFTLAQALMHGGPEPEVLHKLSAFFADAATRLSQILAGHDDLNA